jgi:hypothetical protein
VTEDVPTLVQQESVPQAPINKGDLYKHHSGRLYIVNNVIVGGVKVGEVWFYDPFVVYAQADQPIKEYGRFARGFLASMVKKA